MTLIARAIFEDVPIYFGDLLISHRARERQSRVDIPAANDINALLPTSASYHVAGMRQKLNILSDRLIVAWAGSEIHAKVTLRELRDVSGQPNFDVNAVLNHLRALPPDELKVSWSWLVGQVGSGLKVYSGC